MKLKDIATKNPEVIHPDQPICEAANKMKNLDVGMLPVCDGERLVGAVTDRDIAVRAVAQGCDPRSTKVREVMSPEICYCFDDEEVATAARVMEEKQIRRLPILNRDKRLVGIVSLGDLALRSMDDEMAEQVLEGVSQK
jgi:CBS domain-containing protein